MTQPIGFAIVGIGVIAVHHARAIRATPDAHLVSVFARDLAKGQAAAEQLGCEAAPTLAQVLGDPRVQVVVITTPSGAHADIAIAAAKAGKHILCEKPLDITLERTDRIIAACAAAKVILCPVFQNRFDDKVDLVRETIRSNRLGRLLIGRASIKWKRTEEYYRSGSWRGTRALDGGGCLMNQGIHTIDLLVHLMGRPVEVVGQVANLRHQGIEVEDTACALLRFANGAMGLIEGTTATDPQLPAIVEISGTNGTVALNGEFLGQWNLANPEAADLIRRQTIIPDPVQPDEHEARLPKHRRQLDDLIGSIRRGALETSIPPSDSRLAVEVILGIYESAATGKPYRFT